MNASTESTPNPSVKITPKTTGASDESSKQIPGIELIGRGIYLRPRQPYQLKRSLLSDEGSKPQKLYFSRDTGNEYSVPRHVEVNNSPPMPAQQAVNRLIIEDSSERLHKEMSFDANLASSAAAFSVNLNASQATQLSSEQEAFYALRNSFVPLFTVYVPDGSLLSIDQKDIDRIPDGPFEHNNRMQYLKFFEKYGTHYVRTVWVGGSATLAFTILKSSSMSKTDIQMGIKASLGPIGSAEANTKLANAKESLQANADCTVWGKGGEPLKLAALTSLDNATYDAWLQSVLDNPEAIELEVAGIWTLLNEEESTNTGRQQPNEDDAPKDTSKPEREQPSGKAQTRRAVVAAAPEQPQGPRARALMDAYKAETSFKPLSSVVQMGNSVWFIQDTQVFNYDMDLHKAAKPERIAKRFPELAKMGFSRIDAAFSRQLPVTHDQTIADLFLFREEHFKIVRVVYEYRTKENGQTDDTPTSKDQKANHAIDSLDSYGVSDVYNISDCWPVEGFERIDAAIYAGPERLYFFRKDQYVRFSLPEFDYEMLREDTPPKPHGELHPPYPQPIKEGWPGVTFDRIDAAIYWGNEKAYFFRGDQYIRYDMVNRRADPGYPKYIPSGYVEDWQFFE